MMTSLPIKAWRRLVEFIIRVDYIILITGIDFLTRMTSFSYEIIYDVIFYLYAQIFQHEL